MSGVSVAEMIGILASAVIAILSAVIGAAWVLANKIAASKADMTSQISTVRADVTTQISSLKLDLAVLKKSEESRDEKINRMWDWWMKSLENGWMQHMKSRSEQEQ